MNLPADFIARIRNAYPNGAEWLEALPALVERAARRWGLTDIAPVPNLSYNFVAFARRNSNREDAKGAKEDKDSLRGSFLRGEYPQQVVLKIGPPNAELASEIAALRLLNGRGCCRLLDADDEHYTLLLERLRPGRLLSEVEDDDEATRIAAEVMLRVWRTPSRPAPDLTPHPPSLQAKGAPAVRSGEVPTAEGAGGWDQFIKLSDWFAALDGLRPGFGCGTGPFPRKLVERVESVLPALIADPMGVLLHGDFHHFNVLSSGAGWLAIDPKGVMGPRGYECGPLLINPWDDFAKRPDAVKITQRRVAILGERLGLERQVILDWGLCHALLSAWWDTDARGAGGEYSIACGEIFLKARV